MNRRRRGLSGEDRELWAYVTRDVAPLKHRVRRDKTPHPVPEKPVSEQAPASQKEPAAPVSRPAKPVVPVLPPIAPIDKREKRQLLRGTRGIDARIDLHGMRQGEAHNALRGFLAIAQMRGYSTVLVITGKGASGENHFSFDERGVLRRVVPQWLRLPDMRALVIGFEEAYQGHGGAGALYVRVRRVRKAALP